MGEYMGTSPSVIMKVLILVACLAAVAFAQPRNQLTCDICTDIMTDLTTSSPATPPSRRSLTLLRRFATLWDSSSLGSRPPATCWRQASSQLSSKDLLTTTWTPLRSALTFWEPVLKNLSTKIQIKKICRCFFNFMNKRQYWFFF